MSPFRTLEAPASGASTRIEPAVLRSALTQLERELARPLEGLRSSLTERFAGVEAARLSALSETCQPATLLGLCDDLMDLTRVFLDETAVREDALVPRGDQAGVSLWALMEELDRWFAPEAARREVDWCHSFLGPDVSLEVDGVWLGQAVARAVSDALARVGPGAAVLVSAGSEAGEVVIEVRVEGAEPAGASVESPDDPEQSPLRLARMLMERQRGRLEVDCEADGVRRMVLRLPLASEGG